ncbi:hypothetical protein ACOME3_000005 [Neoechinorhynchus agilis]
MLACPNKCAYSTDSMIKRHDEVQKCFTKALSYKLNVHGSSRYTIDEDVKLHDADGNLWKPDIIISEEKSGKVYIADIAIYYESNNDRAANMAKAKETKYDVLRSIVAQLYKTNINKVSTIGIPVGSRGSFSPTLINRLAKFRLNQKTAMYMANAAARGSIKTFHFFMERHSNP